MPEVILHRQEVWEANFHEEGRISGVFESDCVPGITGLLFISHKYTDHAAQISECGL